MRHFALALLLGTVLALPAAASELDDTVAALRAVTIAEVDNTVVPPALVPLEARFKRLLREEAIRALPDVDADQLDLAALKPALDALARRYASADDDDAAAYRSGPIYGYVLDVHAEHPRGRPDLVAIVTNVRVGCGQDASLALLERRQGRWRDVLDVDAGAIRHIDDAFYMFDYQVGPVARDGSFTVVDAHVTPWCQSNWRALRHAVHRVPARGAARAIFHGAESITIGVADPVYEIRLGSAGYSLHFTAEGPADDPASWRSRTMSFDVRGDHVRHARTRFDPS